MTVSKITNAPSQKGVIDKINEVIDNLGGGGGTATDVQINGTSITNNDVANIITQGTYNASSNKIATINDLPAIPTFNTPLDFNATTNEVNLSLKSPLYVDTSENTMASNIIEDSNGRIACNNVAYVSAGNSRYTNRFYENSVIFSGTGLANVTTAGTTDIVAREYTPQIGDVIQMTPYDYTTGNQGSLGFILGKLSNGVLYPCWAYSFGYGRTNGWNASWSLKSGVTPEDAYAACYDTTSVKTYNFYKTAYWNQTDHNCSFLVSSIRLTSAPKTEIYDDNGTTKVRTWVTTANDPSGVYMDGGVLPDGVNCIMFIGITASNSADTINTSSLTQCVPYIMGANVKTAGNILKADARYTSVATPKIALGFSIDQYYNSTSTNPQSGTAVAKAISTKQNTLTAVAPIEINSTPDSTLKNETPLLLTYNDSTGIYTPNFTESAYGYFDIIIPDSINIDVYNDYWRISNGALHHIINQSSWGNANSECFDIYRDDGTQIARLWYGSQEYRRGSTIQTASSNPTSSWIAKHTANSTAIYDSGSKNIAEGYESNVTSGNRLGKIRLYIKPKVNSSDAFLENSLGCYWSDTLNSTTAHLTSVKLYTSDSDTVGTELIVQQGVVTNIGLNTSLLTIDGGNA